MYRLLLPMLLMIVACNAETPPANAAAKSNSVAALKPMPTDAQKPTVQPVEKPAVQTVEKPAATLVFFMNPNGRPCQIQNQILEDSRGQWGSLAQVRYVSTEVPADREQFYKYGVRSLPNLILLGADGNELMRFSPGIQPAETIVAGIQSKINVKAGK